MSDDNSSNPEGQRAIAALMSELGSALSSRRRARHDPDPGASFTSFAAIRGEPDPDPPPTRGWSPEDFWSDTRPDPRPCEGCDTTLLPLRHPVRDKWLIVRWCPACQDEDVQATVAAAEAARTYERRLATCGLHSDEIEEARASPATLDPHLTRFTRPPARSSRWCSLLAGQPGTGKSTQAALVVVHHLEQGWRCLYTLEADLIESIIKPSAPDLRRTPEFYAAPELLVIDEVGRGSRHPDGRAAVLRVLDHRYRRRLPTLLISNLDLTGVAALLGSSSGSRLFSGCGGKALVYTREWRAGGVEVGPPSSDPQDL